MLKLDGRTSAKECLRAIILSATTRAIGCCTSPFQLQSRLFVLGCKGVLSCHILGATTRTIRFGARTLWDQPRYRKSRFKREYTRRTLRTTFISLTSAWRYSCAGVNWDGANRHRLSCADTVLSLLSRLRHVKTSFKRAQTRVTSDTMFIPHIRD